MEGLDSFSPKTKSPLNYLRLWISLGLSWPSEKFPDKALNPISGSGLHWMGSRGEAEDHRINVPWKDGLDPFFFFFFLFAKCQHKSGYENGR